MTCARMLQQLFISTVAMERARAHKMEYSWLGYYYQYAMIHLCII